MRSMRSIDVWLFSPLQVEGQSNTPQNASPNTRPHPPYQWNCIPQGLLEKLQEIDSSFTAAILQDIIGQIEQQESLICAACRERAYAHA